MIERDVVIVNGEAIKSSVLRSEVTDLRNRAETSGTILSVEDRLNLRTEAVSILIERTLLVQEARRLNLEPPPEEVAQTLAGMAARPDGVVGCRVGADTPKTQGELKRRMTIDRLVEHWRKDIPRPRTSEVNDFYRTHRSQFRRPEMVNAAHMVRHVGPGITDEAAKRHVEELRERVLAGEPFNALAQSLSDCPEQGGELGWFVRGVMVEEFDSAVFSVSPGQLTPVFQTCFGFHFAWVRDRRPAGIPAFKEVQPLIIRRLSLEAEEHALAERIKRLHAVATVQVMP